MKDEVCCFAEGVHIPVPAVEVTTLYGLACEAVDEIAVAKEAAAAVVAWEVDVAWEWVVVLAAAVVVADTSAEEVCECLDPVY